MCRTMQLLIISPFFSLFFWSSCFSSIKVYSSLSNYTFFYKKRHISTQLQCCLTFSWIELQMLPRCCFIYITIIKLRYILYLVYLCPCLGLGQFVSYLCDLFFFYFQPHFQCYWSHNVTKANSFVFCTFFRMSTIIFGW